MFEIPHFNLPAWASAVVAFLSLFISEIDWVLSVRWTSAGKVHRVAALDAFMVLVGWGGLVVLLGNPLVAIPAEIAGAVCGVYAAFWLDRKFDAKL